ncbi:oxidoreductase [Actinoplanes sp. SE50]|uniref:molybdopterin-dependent oxidoreductase n=1 Tax=unclassified Actinoplanes TaxID=2626549 RepID=UPI00023ED064|nr:MULTISPECIES: molybdopterin-dependent oxidoreductase [unclassified Actinoplanes]AEV84366.1 putative membrane-bound oxidoreductase [Actinoplanes sp. SE50/110]ATO82758.1 oxidoreductase [Actinoplanes sp. SE50]SLM00165.1 oxidoreductase [Actinoplanes sp. SE50/110]
MRRTLLGAISGIVAAGSGVAVAELLAAATRPGAGPLVAVGGAVIDATPTPWKEFAVRELGTNDKPVLLAVIGVVLAGLALATGIAATRWRAAIPVGTALLGAVGAAAALSRPTATLPDAVPAVVGAAVAGVLLWWLLRKPRPVDTGVRENGVDRRLVLRLSLLAAGASVVEGSALAVSGQRQNAAGQSREALRLPAAADPAKPLPGGIGRDFTTGNTAFYRVDTALTVPRIDPSTWSLRIHGMVDREIEMSFAELLRRPLIERDITLNCVSNEVGGPYIGTARWLGVPLAALLREAGVQSGADQIVARSDEGMTIGTPVATALDGRDTMLAVGMNGEPLPLEHGFPVRMLTPGLYGYAGACKWVTEIELTTFDRFDAYWVKRGWGVQGTVKTASRIDKPKPFARMTAGPVTVAGVAWAQRRGIAAVEVSVDGGPWQPAELLPTASIDTWVQWRFTWKATPGPHSLAVRATDSKGAVQPQDRATPFPDGATGWHTISVTVS